MKNVIIALILSVTTFCIACKKEAAPQGNPASSSLSAGGGHAPQHAVPGSHEDWCGEHEVPESMCTKCNPALIAAFRATGDWCEEHGLPESQCRLCNPNLSIVRPPQKQGQ